MNNLARGYQVVGKLDLALPLFEETLALRKSEHGPYHSSTLTSMHNLATAYQDAGKFDRALPLLREEADLLKQQSRADTSLYAAVLASLGLSLLQQEKWAEAETLLREALNISERKAPDDWGTFNTKAMLGGALLGETQYAAAEPLLRAGYEGMKLRAEKIPLLSRPRLTEALDRLIKLAEATNRPDEARMWKDERAKLPGAPAPKPEAENP
jgi:tetratricopeptide (TPR) repeat protein